MGKQGIWEMNGKGMTGRMDSRLTGRGGAAFYARAESHAPELLIELGTRAFVALVDEANLGMER